MPFSAKIEDLLDYLEKNPHASLFAATDIYEQLQPQEKMYIQHCKYLTAGTICAVGHESPKTQFLTDPPPDPEKELRLSINYFKDKYRW